jgi:hypothetical protein
MRVFVCFCFLLSSSACVVDLPFVPTAGLFSSPLPLFYFLQRLSLLRCASPLGAVGALRFQSCTSSHATALVHFARGRLPQFCSFRGTSLLRRRLAARGQRGGEAGWGEHRTENTFVTRAINAHTTGTDAMDALDQRRHHPCVIARRALLTAGLDVESFGCFRSTHTPFRVLRPAVLAGFARINPPTKKGFRKTRVLA